MIPMSRRKEYKFLELVKEMPKSVKARVTQYDDLINEFVQSGIEIARIKLELFKDKEGKIKDAKTIFSGLAKRISDKGHRMGISIRGNELYLKLLTEEEYKKKLEKARIIRERLKGKPRKKKTA